MPLTRCPSGCAWARREACSYAAAMRQLRRGRPPRQRAWCCKRGRNSLPRYIYLPSAALERGVVSVSESLGRLRMAPICTLYLVPPFAPEGCYSSQLFFFVSLSSFQNSFSCPFMRRRCSRSPAASSSLHDTPRDETHGPNLPPAVCPLAKATALRVTLFGSSREGSSFYSQYHVQWGVAFIHCGRNPVERQSGAGRLPSRLSGCLQPRPWPRITPPPSHPV